MLPIAALPLAVTACGGDSAASVPLPAAVVAAVAPAVSMSFSPAAIKTTDFATLTWTSTNAATCTGSGAWTGSQATTGTIKVSPLAAGKSTYALSCTGTGGTTSSAATLLATSRAAALPIGLYVGNPNGNEAAPMARFQSDWDASVGQLQRSPQFFGTFVDFGKDWNEWASNARWTAWSFNQSGRTAGMKPVIGIKLSTNAYWNRQSDAFREIIAGQHDQAYRDVVAAWRDQGFTELRFRISYEFDGGFMPDNFGNDAATLALWKQAFAHVADLMHAVPGVKVLIVWNPADINWTSHALPDAYPGDSYVDVIASDIYSALYPLSLHDWSGGPDAATPAVWMQSVTNRSHFWDHPGATPGSTDGSGWGLVQALALALAHHKPFALGETGVGGDDVKTGLSDDPQFPAYLSARLNDFVAQGGVVDHVIIWDYDAGDGKWRFTGVPAKAATAAAWTALAEPAAGP